MSLPYPGAENPIIVFSGRANRRKGWVAGWRPGLERRQLPLGALARALPDEPVALAAITASELLAGVHRADSPARKARREAFVEAVLEAIPVLPFDLLAARVHAVPGLVVRAAVW